MRLRATISKFLLFSCVFCVVGGISTNAIGTQLASTSYVDSSIKRESGSLVIQNSANTPATLSQNPQTTGFQASSNKEVATIGWTDANRTSKVKTKSGNSVTGLVEMWIE